jgi:Ser/Thr protein kinase RdoA (MazF antagonist)
MELASDVMGALGSAYALKVQGTVRRVGERVWRLQTDRGEVAVKQFGADRSLAACHEARLLQHLSTSGDSRFRVPALLPTTSGDALWVGSDVRLMLTHWEPGEFKTYNRFTLLEWAALGRSLAALHLRLDILQLPTLPTLGARLQTLDVAGERRAIGFDLARLPASGSIDAGRLREYLERCLRMIDLHYPGCIEGFPHDDPQSPIHNDYNQFNYLFGDVLPPLVLDWEASIGAPREFEVVRCLNHLPLEAPESARIFMEAYLRVRPLRGEVMAWAVDTAGLMHALKHWILRGWLEEQPNAASRLEGAIYITSVLAVSRAKLIDFFVRCTTAGG